MLEKLGISWLENFGTAGMTGGYPISKKSKKEWCDSDVFFVPILLLVGEHHSTNDLRDRNNMKLSSISCRPWRKLKTVQASKRSTADGPPFQHLLHFAGS